MELDKEAMQAAASEAVTISDKIRRLNEAGYTRTQIATFLERRYQHVRNVLKQDEIRSGAAAQASATPPGGGGDDREGHVPNHKLGSHVELVDHSFVLQRDLTVAMRLPANLTPREAERLAGLVMAIPY